MCYFVILLMRRACSFLKNELTLACNLLQGVIGIHVILKQQLNHNEKRNVHCMPVSTYIFYHKMYMIVLWVLQPCWLVTWIEGNGFTLYCNFLFLSIPRFQTIFPDVAKWQGSSVLQLFIMSWMEMVSELDVEPRSSTHVSSDCWSNKMHNLKQAARHAV